MHHSQGCTCPNAQVGGAQEGLASVWYQVMFLAVDAETRAPRTSGTAIAMTCTQQSCDKRPLLREHWLSAT